MEIQISVVTDKTVYLGGRAVLWISEFAEVSAQDHAHWVLPPVAPVDHDSDGHNEYDGHRDADGDFTGGTVAARLRPRDFLGRWPILVG